MLLSAGGACRMVSVVAPLSTIRVSGSHTVERIPDWAPSRPAASSMLVSAALRGAGLPNKVSIACCWASDGDRPEVPATGGARVKSGGMISGALRATANSSGVRERPRIAAQPLVATAATITRAVTALRMFDRLLGLRALRMVLTSEERTQQQDHYGDANRCVADIEYQKGPEVAEVEVGEVHHIAVASAVEDISQCSAEHHSKRELVDPVLLPPDPHRD